MMNPLEAAAWIQRAFIPVKSRGVHANSRTSRVCQAATILPQAPTETRQNAVQLWAVASSHARLNWVCASQPLGADRVRTGLFSCVLCVISAFLHLHPGNMATPAAVNPSGEYASHARAFKPQPCDIKTVIDSAQGCVLVVTKESRGCGRTPFPHTCNNGATFKSSSHQFCHNVTLILR